MSDGGPWATGPEGRHVALPAAADAAPSPPPLRARIQVPDLAEGTVERRDLLDRLGSREHQVLLVCAAAGFGKTTLLAQWARRAATLGSPAAWVTCSDRSRGPEALFADLREALALALRGAAPHASAQLLELAQPTAASMDSELDALLMLLDDLATPLAVVIDDVHVAQDHGALPLIESVAVNLPGTVRLALGSRVEPRPLATTLRLHGRLVDVAAADLALTRAEVADVVAAAGADPGIADAILAQTEGWPAAVRLGVLAARGTAAGPGAPPPLGADPVISDYLSREIESALPPEALDLLRATAVLTELSPPLAAALGGRPNAGEILARLHQAQALVRRTGVDEPTYTVHALLRAHLLADLAAKDPGAPARQHAAAATWLAAHGEHVRALDHAVAAGDAGVVAGLLRAHGAHLLVTGATTGLMDALAGIPAELWDADLAGVAALVRADRGDLTGARGALVRADSLGAPDPTGPGEQVGTRLPSLERIARFHLRRLEGSPDAADIPRGFPDVLAWRADAAPSEADLDRALILLVTRGQWQFAIGRYEAAWADLRLAQDLATTHRRDHVMLLTMSTLAAVPALTGDAAAEHAYVSGVLSLIEDRGWATHPALANLYAAGAWAASLMLLPDVADQMIGRALHALAGNVDPEYATYAGMLDATLAAQRPGDPGAAMARLARFALGEGTGVVTPRLRSFAAMHRVRIMLTRGDLPGAHAAVDDFRTWFPGTADPLIAAAQVHAAQGLWEQCLAALGRVHEQGLPVVTPLYQVVLPLLESVAEDRLGRRSAARGALLRALAVAAPRGVVRPFWEAGPTMRGMLERQLGRFGVHDDFVTTILQRWDAVEAAADSRPIVAEGAGVALTAREFEVLAALSSLLTAEEIAAAQRVSVNTIRTHTRALYRKLGVRTRRDAVRRGRELGLT